MAGARQVNRNREGTGLIGRLFLFCLLWLLVAGCGKSTGRAPASLPIFFTCDTHGRLEPCGCFVGQFGGLTRLKTLLDTEAPPGAVRVDVGDAIGGKADYDLIQYRYMLRAFGAMKYDALNIGQREARLSLDQLREFKRSSPVPIVSANLLDQSTGKPVFDPYRIIERDGYHIALVGVVDPRGLSDLGAGLKVEDMEPAITRCVAEVRPKSDLIVLLAFTDETTLNRLAQQFYEFQVILGGKVSQPAQELRKENRSLVYFVTNEARALGILRLELSENASLKVDGNQVMFLNDKIVQDPSVRKLVETYRDEVRHTQLAVDDPNNLSADRVPGVRAPAAYVGTKQCLGCHPGAVAVWEKSAHSRAFVALLEHRADADPKCIGCHTVGFGSPTGYRREFGTNKLVQVGCESCHGPGSLHVRRMKGDTSIDFTFRPLDAGDCRKCHFGEYSRPFSWSEFWPAIKHGKEPQRAEGHSL